MAPSLYCDCDISEYTGITHKALCSVAGCGILVQVNNIRSVVNDHYGRTTYTRGRGPYPQSVRVHSQKVYLSRETRRCQSRRSLACQTRSLEGICREQNEAREQIKKAGRSQPLTNEKVAVSSLSNVWTTADNEPEVSYERKAYIQYRQSCLTLSRHKLILCHAHRRARSPKGARSMYIISPKFRFSSLILLCLFSVKSEDE
jgi:hypothetical protein